MRRVLFVALAVLLFPAIAAAQSVNIDLGAAGNAGATSRIVQLTVLLTLLSLAPSLLPRPFFIQGILSGLSFAAGYGLGVATVALWSYLQLPVLRSRTAIIFKSIAALLCLLVAVSFLWQAAHWQNALRAMMGMEESAGLQPLLLGLIAGCCSWSCWRSRARSAGCCGCFRSNCGVSCRRGFHICWVLSLPWRCSGP